MLESWLKLFLGEKICSSLAGIVSGAIFGVATVAITGQITKQNLVTGAIGGAASALVGAGGRATGGKVEKND